MKILQISTQVFKVPPAGYGGLEGVVEDLSVELLKLGHQVAIVAPKGSNVPGAEMITPCAASPSNPEGEAYEFYKNRLPEFEIIHNHAWSAHAYLAKMDNPALRVMDTIHSMQPWVTPPPVKFPCLVGASKYHAQLLSSIYSCHVEVVYHGIQLETYRPAAHLPIACKPISERKYLLYVARIAPFKGCLTPGALIIGESGVKIIEDIQKGERVLADDGNWHAVTDTMRRPYEGPIIEFKYRCFNSSLRVTPEHPLLIAHLLKKKQGNTTSPRKLPYEKKYTRADEVKVGDYLLMPIPQDNPEKLAHLNVADFIPVQLDRDKVVRLKASRYGGPSPIPSKIPLTDDFLALCGLYIAEGSARSNNHSNNKGICFSLSAKEKYLAELIQRVCKETLHVKPQIQYKGSKLKVTLPSQVVQPLFETWFGRGAHNKHFPAWVFSLSEKKLAQLMKFMWLGDGSLLKKPSSYSYGSVSQSLSVQIPLLLSKLGVATSTSGKYKIAGNHANGNSSYSIHVNGYADKLANLWGDKGIRDKQHRNIFIREGYMWMRIKSIDISHYAGSVYNLEVSGANSYTANGCTVHNCHEFITLCHKLNIPGIVVGEDQFVDDKKYVRRVMDACDGKRVQYLGPVPRGSDQMVELMQNAKAVIAPLLPPYGEIFGLSTVETMASGTPFISTDCGAAKELIIEGKTGFVVPSVNELADAIAKLDTIQPEDCLAHVKVFDRASMAKGYVRLYERMMRGEPW